MGPQQQHDKWEMILYHPNSSLELEVRFENETVWLNRHQISLLFGRDVKTICKHINNALREELCGLSSVANFATTAADGKHTRWLTTASTWFCRSATG
ncbi:MAG: hypothetical protein FWG96_05975 [Methanomassiliicoccaceae archaeon]|nr:hypothetical protein [Methanomassiliicoccaceae archaeon]